MITARDFSVLFDRRLFAQAATLSRLLRDDDRDIRSRYVLGMLHWYRYQAMPEGRGERELDDAVALLSRCFAIGDDDLPEPFLPILAEQVEPIAVALTERARVVASPAWLTALVELWQHLLDAASSDHAVYLANLGNALTLRFAHLGDLTDAGRAIEVLERAVEDIPAEDIRQAEMLSTLGTCLQLRYRHTWDQVDLDKAATVLERAVAALPSGHPKEPVVLNNLGNVKRLRYARIGDPADLREAVDLLDQAVKAVSPNDPNHAALCNLSLVLRARFERDGDPADLDTAIEAGRQAVEAAPSGCLDRASCLSALGIALQARYERVGDAADADEAIAVLEQAVQASTRDDHDYGSHLTDLALALRERFDRTGDGADLDTAVELGRRAVETALPGHRNRAMYLSNLGNVLRTRFEWADDPADLDEAVEVGRRAVLDTPMDGRNRAGRLSNVSIALTLRFQRDGNRSDLDEAIEVGRQAMRDTPADHPKRAARLSSWGVALRLRSEHFEDGGNEAGRGEADLDGAVEAGRESVRCIPEDHPHRARFLCNLAAALRLRFERGGVESDLEEARSAYEEAAGAATAAPLTRVEAASSSAGLVVESDPERAADLLEEAVRLLPTVAPRYLRRPDQQFAVGRLAGLAAEAVASVLTSADSKIRAGRDADRAQRDGAERALSLMERARAVLLSQALNTRSDLTGLRERDPVLAARFVRLRDLLERPDRDEAERAIAPGERRRLAKEFEETLIRIRAVDPSFALPPTTEDLLAQSQAGPIVAVNLSSRRSDALLLTKGGITTLPLPDLTPAEVIDQVEIFHQALHVTSHPSTTPQLRIEAQTMMRMVLEWLWDAVTEPVLSTLGYDHEPASGEEWPRLWWVPSGLLGLLPLHAAGYHVHRRTVIDRVVSSYTPTIGALRHARARLALRSGAGEPVRSLIVAMPDTPGHGRLPHVPAEVELVRARLPHPVVLAEPGSGLDGTAGKARKADVLAHLPGSAIAHFACHGHTDTDDLSRSRLLLHDHQDAPLSVATLAQVTLHHASLAYLSACGTAAAPPTELMDEAVHLASAFQLAGFSQVVGTLWEINDRVAVQVADLFYAGLGTNTGRVPHALHHAIRTIRERFPATPSFWAAHIHVGV
ncbi:CHAT domain-containing protein [Nonomuraea sp. NPDC050451]|uniref:CHAT domain-containing protein n=1 Tax=Nonomuraea sp. NPDC050451 TaxID=3364364 RepID=UPI0037A5972B